MMDDKLNWSRALEELQTKTKERHGFFFLFLIFLPYLRLLVQYDDDRWKSKATIKSGSWRWVLSAGTSHWLRQIARRWNELLQNQTQILLKKAENKRIRGEITKCKLIFLFLWWVHFCQIGLCSLNLWDANWKPPRANFCQQQIFKVQESGIAKKEINLLFKVLSHWQVFGNLTSYASDVFLKWNGNWKVSCKTWNWSVPIYSAEDDTLDI